MKKITKPAAKKKAYKAFQMYLRTLWTTSGQSQCYTCDRYYGFSNIQVGHWVTGHNNAVYINEDYVRPQCKGCNIFQGGRQGEFRDRLRKELGDEVVDFLLKASREKVDITVSDYQEMEAWYRQQKELLDNQR